MLGAPERSSLKWAVRSFGTVELGDPHRTDRKATLRISLSAVTLHAPKRMPKAPTPQPLHVVRASEPAPAPKAKRKDVVEWILETSEPVERVGDAWRIAGRYTPRWVIEEYPKCLKTSCAAQERQLEDASRLAPLVAILCLVACRLLQLKSLAPAKDSPPALEFESRDHVLMMGLHRRKDPATSSCRDFWRQVAIMGGFMGRKGDGDPGWLTLWRGWMQLDTMVAGERLVTAQTCGQ